MPTSPFAASSSVSGRGVVHLSLLPPATPTFSTLSYTYPLKLLPSNPHILPQLPIAASEPLADSSSQSPRTSQPLRPTKVPLLFLLSYGGGLLPPDALSLDLTLDPCTRLTITTQGSTKIFPSPPPPEIPTTPSDSICSRSSSAGSSPSRARPFSQQPLTASQTLHTRLHAHSALWLAPDPTQPFIESHYVQRQTFDVTPSASLGLLDWVTEGRRARGESWVFGDWRGVNEVWSLDEAHKIPTVAGEEGFNGEAGKVNVERRLLLRDTLHLSPPSPASGKSLSNQVDGFGIFGTLILLGPVLEPLAKFFVEEFEKMPRIGGRDWGDARKASLPSNETGASNAKSESTKLSREQWRAERIKREKADGIIWSAAKVRECVVVKFAAREAEGARVWMGNMVGREGSVRKEFGEGGMMALR